MKHQIKAVLTVCFAILIALVIATDVQAPTLAKEKIPSGKVLYRQYCKPCHGPEAEHGEYSPLTLIQDQWNRFYDKQLIPSHAELMAPDAPDTKLLDAISEAELKKIRAFSVDHAADSESPMTCG